MALRPSKTGGLIALFSLGIVVAAVLARAFGHMARTSPTMARLLSGKVPVETSVARVARLDAVVGASGSVEPVSRVSYVSAIEGRLVEVPVDLGTIVRKGDLLLRWDDRAPRASVGRAKERIESARALGEYTRNQVARLRVLQESGLVAGMEYEEAVLKSSQARLDLAEAQEEMVRSSVALEHTELVSPIDGIVLERLVNPGELTVEKEPLLRLGELAQVVLVAQVGEEDAGSIALGQPAEVTCAAHPGVAFEGAVAKIDPSTDAATRAFAAYVRIPNPDLRIRPGSVCFARMRRTRNAVAVPSLALLNPLGDRAGVFVVDENGVARLREVRVGVVSEGLTEIVSGLEDGEAVVTVGQLRLRDGDTVRDGAALARR